MKRLVLALAGALIAGTALPANAHAANIWSQPRYEGYGGTYIFIDGEIAPGDDKIFDNVSRNAVAPVYVHPAGPGGAAMTALAIGDMIAERGYSTIMGNGYKCISSCALIWASGYGQPHDRSQQFTDLFPQLRKLRSR